MTSNNLARPLSKLAPVLALALLGAGCATTNGTSDTRSAIVSPPAAYVVCTASGASRLPAARADDGCQRGPSLPPSLGLMGGGSAQRLH